jgi:hypothetical protein
MAENKLTTNPSFAPAGPAIGGCSSSDSSLNGSLLLRGCTIFMRFAPVGATGIPASPAVIRGGNCFVCHNLAGGGAVGNPDAPLLSQAAFRAGDAFAPIIRVGSQVPGQNHTHDQGFMSLGLRPVFTDLISGGTDPYGNPLSFSRQYWNFKKNGTPVVDPYLQRAITASDQEIASGSVLCPPQGSPPGTAPSVPCSNKLGVTLFDSSDPGLTLLGVDGASKSPILRNVALTPPYFSWGGYPSLRQALKLYNRGFNRRDMTLSGEAAHNGVGCASGDNSGTGPDGNRTLSELQVAGSNCASNTTGTITTLGLIDCEASAFATFCAQNNLTPANDDLAALETFLKAMTDRRVQCDQAPFDHPSLKILVGHRPTDSNGDGKADDIVFNLPAVGASGYSQKSGYCIPNSGDLFAPGMQSRSGGLKVALP